MLCAKLTTEVLSNAQSLNWASTELTTLPFDSGVRRDEQAYSERICNINKSRMVKNRLVAAFHILRSLRLLCRLRSDRLCMNLGSHSSSSGTSAESVLCPTLTMKHSHVKCSATERLGESRPSILSASHSSAILPDPARLSLGDSDVGLALWGLGKLKRKRGERCPEIHPHSTPSIGWEYITNWLFSSSCSVIPPPPQISQHCRSRPAHAS